MENESGADESVAGDATRTLRRLIIQEGATGLGTSGTDSVVAILDVETTGIDPAQDRIIELAIRRCRFDRDGIITEIGRIYRWLEDPGWALDPEISRLTGLTDGSGGSGN